MSTFDVAFGFLRQAEGGYVRDPADAGGETFMGISRAAHGSWPGWAVIDAAAGAGDDYPDRLAADPGMVGLARNFYRSVYWDRYGLGELPVRLATVLLDGLVQHGCGLRLAQQTLNRCQQGPPLVEDNEPGPATRARLLAAGADGFIEAYLARREEYYRALAARPGQGRFLRGWLNRLARLRAYIAGLGPDDGGPGGASAGYGGSRPGVADGGRPAPAAGQGV